MIGIKWLDTDELNLCIWPSKLVEASNGSTAASVAQ
jgi:hypothetical protein